jgi:hypothetical protein
MHYAHVVLIDPKELGEQFSEDAIEKKVESMMAPYDYDLEVEPYKEYLDKDDIESMVRHYGTYDLVGLATHMKDWDDSPGGVDENGLYRLTTSNPKRKWDWWRIGGRWDGMVSNQPRSSDGGYNWSPIHEQVNGNVVLLKTIDHEINCHSLITPDGEWHEIQMVYQTGWKAPFQAPHAELTEEQLAANQASWKEEDDRLEAEWFAQKRDVFAKYGYCLAVGVDYHS